MVPNSKGDSFMTPLKIMLAHLTFTNDFTYNKVPLSIGYIASYIKERFDKSVQVSLYRDPHKFLKDACEKEPHIIGLSLYNWNADLVRETIRLLKNKLGSDTIIVAGGASVDSDREEQEKLFGWLHGLDALIPGEGESGFANLVNFILTKNTPLWSMPIEGIVFRRNDTLICGGNLNQPIDLTSLPSPYLKGFLDEFLCSCDPLIQTTRGCPYNCAYCVAGKDRFRLRKFPQEQIKDEIRFIAKAYLKRPHVILFFTDENFGLFSADVEISDYVCKTSAEFGYPRSIYFYLDKHLTNNVKRIIKKVGKLNTVGYFLALQSCNEKTLHAVKRKNISESKIIEALDWAATNKLHTYTDMIFGLPYETRESFVNALVRVSRYGFDRISIYNCLLLPGTELNRESARKQYGLQTKFRLQGTNYGYLEDGIFTAESEEVVISSSSFSFDDYMSVRKLNFLFYNIYNFGFYRWFFNGINCSRAEALIEFFENFFNPDKNKEWPTGYLQFLSDLNDAFSGELYDSKEKMKYELEKKYRENQCNAISPTRLNILFGARMMYLEASWVPVVFKHLLHNVITRFHSKDLLIALEELLELSRREIIFLKSLPASMPEPLMVHYDIIRWNQKRPLLPLKNYRLKTPKEIVFTLSPVSKDTIIKLNEDIRHLDELSYFHKAIDLIEPKSDLFYSIKYKTKKLVGQV